MTVTVENCMAQDPVGPHLSEREIEVLREWLLSDSKSRVAQNLYISVGTVGDPPVADSREVCRRWKERTDEMRITRASDTRSDSDDRRTLIDRVAFDKTASASDEILRLFGRFIGAGYVCYLILLAPPAIAEATTMSASWWTPLAVVATFGSGLALGASTFHADTRWVKRTASANAVLYVVVILLWWPAWNGDHVTDFTLWISNFPPGVASLAAAAAWRPAAAVVHLFVVATLAQLTNHIIRTSPTTHLLVPDLAFAWTFCAVFVAAAVMALRTGRVLDATIATTHAAAAGAAAAEAKSVERERFDALIHDTVMSTLLAASRNDADPSVVAQARRTVARLDELRSGTDHETSFDFDGILAQLRSAASEVDENITFETALSDGSDPSGYAPDSIRAMAGAMAEALRNSVKHAGSSARRSVTVTATATHLEVVVTDDASASIRAPSRRIASESLSASAAECVNSTADRQPFDRHPAAALR